MYNNKGIEIFNINSNTLNFFNKYSLLKKRKTPPINKTLKIKVPILRQIPKKNNNINKSINKTNYDISFNKSFKYNNNINNNNNNDNTLNNKNPIKIEFDFEKIFFNPKIQKRNKDNSFILNNNKTYRNQIPKFLNNYNEYKRLNIKNKNNNSRNNDLNNNKNEKNNVVDKKFAKSYDNVNGINNNNKNNNSSKNEDGELDIEDVKDIIIYYPFNNEIQNNHFLFYKNDYNLFISKKKNNYLNFFIKNH